MILLGGHHYKTRHEGPPKGFVQNHENPTKTGQRSAFSSSLCPSHLGKALVWGPWAAQLPDSSGLPASTLAPAAHPPPEPEGASDNTRYHLPA